MNKDEVLKLAKLARIKILPEEAEALSHEFDRILEYVGEVKGINIKSDGEKSVPHTKNVFREDTSPHETGLYTADLLDQSPEREGDYLKVKKIL
jgi:aspartyl-tRNA(Asn)/glutamyl-tRNA(Gln) amidotransferase subunit C